MRRECRELPVDGPHEDREPVLPRFGDNRDPTGRDTDDQDTVPKCLPAGVCTTLVEEYNKITIDGDRRQFPEKQLLSIEKVLARMYHEHHTSKMYTATSLGEIMSQINSDRTKDPTEKRLILDDKSNISEKSQEDWDVRCVSPTGTRN